MTEKNTVTRATGSEKTEREPFRPTADVDKVYETIAQSLGDIVHDAAHNACGFVSLFRHYDRNTDLTTRAMHLVHARDCLDVARVHLDQLGSLISARMASECGADIDTAL